MKELRRIAIVAIGTHGDVQPYIALGFGRQAAGRLITIATSAAFEPLVRSQKLLHYPMTGDEHI